MNSGSCALPPVSEVAVAVADSELTTLPAAVGVEHLQHGARRIGELQVRRRSALLSWDDDRAHAAGEIDPDDLVVGIRRRGLQRQRLPPWPSDTIVTLCVHVAGIGIAELHRIAGQHAADVDVEPGLAARTSPPCRSSSGSTAPATSGWRVRRAGSAPAAGCCRASAGRRRAGPTGWRRRRSGRWWCRPARSA